MASNFSGENAKGAFTLPLSPRCTFIMYRVYLSVFKNGTYICIFIYFLIVAIYRV
jgi:hypothetical protein